MYYLLPNSFQVSWKRILAENTVSVLIAGHKMYFLKISFERKGCAISYMQVRPIQCSEKQKQTNGQSVHKKIFLKD